MKIFLAVSYSSQVDYDTGEVSPEYRDWLETQIDQLKSYGHEVGCALLEDDYKINDSKPDAAFRLDESLIKNSDAVLAYVSDVPSAGVQTEIGYALALGKRVYIAHEANIDLAYFNKAIVMAGQAEEIILPLREESLKSK